MGVNGRRDRTVGGVSCPERNYFALPRSDSVNTFINFCRSGDLIVRTTPLCGYLSGIAIYFNIFLPCPNSDTAFLFFNV